MLVRAQFTEFFFPKWVIFFTFEYSSFYYGNSLLSICGKEAGGGNNDEYSWGNNDSNYNNDFHLFSI